MKKYIKLNHATTDAIKDKALDKYKSGTMDTRNVQGYIAECYISATLDELVKQGILKFEYNSMNKVEYFINGEINNGSNKIEKRNTTGNTNKD